MHLLRTLAAGLLILCAQAGAEVVVYTSKDGVVLLSKTKGHYYTLDLKGRDIRPVGQDSSANPMFVIDGRFFQVDVIPLKDFKGTPSSPEMETLRKYLAYETAFFKGHLQDVAAQPAQLSKNKEALSWTANTVPSREVAKQQTNVMLAFVHGDYVMNLGTSVDAGKSTDEARKTLATVARSFSPSAKAISLKFNKDGSYTRE